MPQAVLKRFVGSEQFEGLFQRSEEHRLAMAEPDLLTPEEAMALWLYTTFPVHSIKWHRRINEALWQNPAPRNITALAELLDSAIDKLPVASARRVFRGVAPPDTKKFLVHYLPGALVDWPGFSSAASEYEKRFKGSVEFFINHINGREVGAWTAAGTEESEVIIPRQSRFRVDSVAVDASKSRIYFSQIW